MILTYVKMTKQFNSLTIHVGQTPLTGQMSFCTKIWPVIFHIKLLILNGPSWLWSYGGWIYNYIHVCNHYLSPLKLWVRILWGGTLQHYVIIFVWFAIDTCRSGVFSINKIDLLYITEILLKVALNTIKHIYFSPNANPPAQTPGQVKLNLDKWKLWKNLFVY
jgi:hypothetical protein